VKGGYFDTIEKTQVSEEDCYRALYEFRDVIEFFHSIESNLFQLSFTDYRTLLQSTLDYWNIFRIYRSQDK
jgi:hypothetical protein